MQRIEILATTIDQAPNLTLQRLGRICLAASAASGKRTGVRTTFLALDIDVCAQAASRDERPPDRNAAPDAPNDHRKLSLGS